MESDVVVMIRTWISLTEKEDAAANAKVVAEAKAEAEAIHLPRDPDTPTHPGPDINDKEARRLLDPHHASNLGHLTWPGRARPLLGALEPWHLALARRACAAAGRQAREARAGHQRRKEFVRFSVLS